MYQHLKCEYPFGPEILLLRIYSRNVIMNMCKYLATVMVTGVLLPLKIRRQSKCPIEGGLSKSDTLVGGMLGCC